MKRREGWAVKIQRTDGSEFLSCSSPGILPAVFASREQGRRHHRELKETFRCRLVRVQFSEPEEITVR